MKKIAGIIAFLLAIGMIIMMMAENRLLGIIIIALLLFVGYQCVFCD